jgi:thiamine biosynthesis lipoprotein
MIHNKKQKFQLLLFTTLSISCSKYKPESTNFNGNVFGTTFSISIYDFEPSISENDIDSIFNLFNVALSTYNPNSLISKFNAHTTEKFFLLEQNFPEITKKWFSNVLLISQEIHLNSKGYFDPSASSLFEFWKRGIKEESIFDTQKLEALKKHVGMNRIEFDPIKKVIKKPKSYSLNFNAIAKGYALDVLADFFDSKGIENYLIEIGGEIKCKGKPLEKDFWNIAINYPNPELVENKPYDIVSVQNTAIATSGNYKDFYYLEGEMIGHTINPKTGFPAKNNLLSVTVFHDDCAVADAYATAFMTMGLIQSIGVMSKVPDIACYFIFEIDNSLKDTLVVNSYRPFVNK